LKKYLLDTNICIYFLKGLYDLGQRIEKEKVENCYVSEITIAVIHYLSIRYGGLWYLDSSLFQNALNHQQLVADLKKEFYRSREIFIQNQRNDFLMMMLMPGR
jgi:predicted nucleic acid-binding protein